MDFIVEGLKGAFHLIASGNRDVLGVLWLTLRVSTAAVLIAAAAGLPLGFLLAVADFRGKGIVLAAVNTLMSMPTVTVGLIVFAMISRRGPLGSLGLLFTPSAIVIGEVLLALPIITALSCSAVGAVDPAVSKTARTLGAGSWGSAIAVLREGKYAVMAALVAGYGRVVAEVGAAMMLGGNIKGVTRTLTTAIAFETGKGEFAFSTALGLILLLLAFAVTGTFHLLHRRF